MPPNFKEEIAKKEKALADKENLLIPVNKYLYDKFKKDEKEKFDIQERKYKDQSQFNPKNEYEAKIANLDMLERKLNNLLSNQKTEQLSIKPKTKKDQKMEDKKAEKEFLEKTRDVKANEYYAQFAVDIFERYNGNIGELDTKYLPDGWQISLYYSDGKNSKYEKVINSMIYFNANIKQIVYAIRQTDITNPTDFLGNVQLFFKGSIGFLESEQKYLQKLYDIINSKHFENYKITLVGHSAGGTIVLGIALYLANNERFYKYLDNINKVYAYNPYLSDRHLATKDILKKQQNKEKLLEKLRVYIVIGDPISNTFFTTSDIIKSTKVEKKLESYTFSFLDEHNVLNFVSENFLRKNFPNELLFMGKQVDIEKLPEAEISKEIEVLPQINQQAISQQIKNIEANDIVSMSKTEKTEKKVLRSQTQPDVEKTAKQTLAEKYDDLYRNKKIDAKEFFRLTSALETSDTDNRAAFTEPRERVRKEAIYKEVSTIVDGQVKKQIVKTERVGESEKTKIQINPKAFKPKQAPKVPAVKFVSKLGEGKKDKSTKENAYNVPKKDSDRYQSSIIPLGKELPKIKPASKKEVMHVMPQRSLIKKIETAMPSYKL